MSWSLLKIIILYIYISWYLIIILIIKVLFINYLHNNVRYKIYYYEVNIAFPVYKTQKIVIK